MSFPPLKWTLLGGGGGVICPLLQYDYDPTLAVKIVV